jgi:hypothetical protein
VENNLITLVPQQGAFIVNGQKGKYCVTLFPKETCQCVSTSTCYHILAAKMSIGLEAIQKNRVVNLRALSKNSKKKIDKKSGRKQPRVNDYEIEFEPAPDWTFTLNTPLKQNVMKTPSTVGSVKPTPKKMNDLSTPKSKRKIDLSAIVEEENDTELPDILNVREKIDDINSNKSLPVKKRIIENVTVENNEIEKHKNYYQQQWICYCKIQHKHEILNKEYLCSDVIFSAQNLLKIQFPDINGFQETTLANIGYCQHNFRMVKYIC